MGVPNSNDSVKEIPSGALSCLGVGHFRCSQVDDPEWPSQSALVSLRVVWLHELLGFFHRVLWLIHCYVMSLSWSQSTLLTVLCVLSTCWLRKASALALPGFLCWLLQRHLCFVCSVLELLISPRCPASFDWRVGLEADLDLRCVLDFLFWIYNLPCSPCWPWT